MYVKKVFNPVFFNHIILYKIYKYNTRSKPPYSSRNIIFIANIINNSTLILEVFSSPIVVN